MSIQQTADRLRARKVSSVELTRASLDRIAKLDGKLNAFITVMEESALARARQADAELAHGQDRGPLHGIPVAVKDVFCTRGVRTTCGSKIYLDHVPDHNAAAVEKLEAAGAVLVGKTNLHELAYGITSSNPHFGAVRNPWDPERIAGGSSGGSGAAVAAGMVFMALGTDSGGSIRIPASYCGTVGLKPTFGRVSRYGVMPLDFSLDHVGPLTRTVRDAALTLQVLAGADPRDDTASPHPVENYLPPKKISLKGVRVGWPENFYFDHVDREVALSVKLMADLAEERGAQVVPLRVPDMTAVNTIARVIQLAEASALMEPFLKQRDNFGPDVLALLDQGRLLSATDYVNAQRLRRVEQRKFQQLWKKVDCLFTPTTPIPAPKVGQSTVQTGDRAEDVRLASTRLVRGMNVLGLPALSIFCAFNHEGLPFGLQIVGKPFSEAAILRVGAALEDGTASPEMESDL
jgi:aspartyl-tRNA(Asn)/glutamyl-tRNA(Gln) amidotransferase subunit A